MTRGIHRIIRDLIKFLGVVIQLLSVTRIYSGMFEETLHKIRQKIISSQFILNEEILKDIANLYAIWEKMGIVPSYNVLGRLHTEYGKAEYFLNVDSGGEAVQLPAAVLREYHDILSSHHKLGCWFQETADERGKSCLLVARWLAHFIGIRHRCAHIFLNHPEYPEYIYVQLRRFQKVDAPGQFDIAVGGHVAGIETIHHTLADELKQELNLDVQKDIFNLELCGTYDYQGIFPGNKFYNIEYRTVYSAAIKSEALARIHFPDGEVAALCLFSLNELKELIRKEPARIASGLAESLKFYRRV